MQIWWYGTSRCAVSLTVLAASVLESAVIHPVLLSCYRVTIGGASEEMVGAMLEII